MTAGDPRPHDNVEGEPPPGLLPFGDDVDDTLIETMLQLKLSDRLRTLCRYADAIARFRAV